MSNKQESVEVNSDETIDFNDLFPAEFMTLHTKAKDVYTFFKNGGFDAKSDEAFEKIDETQLDSYVKEYSDFENWQEMLGMASNEFIAKKFDF